MVAHSTPYPMPHQTPYSTQKELKATRARANGRLDEDAHERTVPEPVAPVAPPTTSSEVDALIATELVESLATLHA